MGNTRKAALITGGAVRVGQAISLALAEAGYDIALHYYGSEDTAKDTATKIEAMGQNCTLHRADLMDASTIPNLMDDVHTQHPNLHVLVNNASIFEPANFAEVTLDHYDRHMALNLRAPFFLTQAFTKKCTDGSIINILDTRITRGGSHKFFDYLLSKKSLAELTRMTARQVGPDFRVNGLALGTILPSPGADETYIAEKQQTLPLQTTANLRDVTTSLLQLLDNPALTGQVLFVDGGEQLF